MNFFRNRVLYTTLSAETFLAQLETSEVFEGIFESKTFNIREYKFFHNRLLFPVINGLIEEDKGSTNILISFKVCKTDAIATIVFLGIVVLLAVVFGIVFHDILFLLTLLLCGVISAILFISIYRINCRRALRKMRKLTNS